MIEKFLTTQEVATLLNVSTHRVSDFRNKGLLRGTRFGQGWFYTEDDINTFIQNVLGKDLRSINKMTNEAVKKKYLTH